LTSQEPVTLADSEPEPDVMVVRGNRRQFIRRHPRPEEVALVLEGADATLKRDRGTKKRIYARGGIPVYWLIDLIDMRIEVYTHPTGPTSKPDYLTQQVYYPGDELAFVLAGEEVATIRVESLLPLTEME
jgi:Uma2 family endonuclease